MKESNNNTPGNANQISRGEPGALDFEKFISQPPEKLLPRLLEEHGLRFWEALGERVEHFGLCECGRHGKQINVFEYNYMHCLRCMTYWHAGPTWRQEDESVWRRNEEVITASREIESSHPYICFGIASYLRDCRSGPKAHAGAQRDWHEKSGRIQ